MAKRLPSHLPLPFDQRDDEEIATVLMQDEGSEGIFDDLRQRYERRVEAQTFELLDGEEPSAPVDVADDVDDRFTAEISLEPAHDASPSDVPWYAWMLVVASLLMLVVTGATLVLLVL